jgi:hypothetical protein
MAETEEQLALFRGFVESGRRYGSDSLEAAA